jgi:hypothetical protein
MTPPPGSPTSQRAPTAPSMSMHRRSHSQRQRRRSRGSTSRGRDCLLLHSQQAQDFSHRRRS